MGWVGAGRGSGGRYKSTEDQFCPDELGQVVGIGAGGCGEVGKWVGVQNVDLRMGLAWRRVPCGVQGDLDGGERAN